MHRHLLLPLFQFAMLPIIAHAQEPTQANSSPLHEGQPVILFQDSMTGDWPDHWFLDGKQATVTTSDDGLYFSGGTVTKADDPVQYHAHHAVLWTRQSFEGDLRISFQMTREDDDGYGNTLLYIQAQGIGSGPYAKDITEWNKLREVPSMDKYFARMDLISVSFRDNLRCKRYPWKDDAGEWYPGKGLIKPMVDYPGIETGKTYQVEVEKTAESLTFRLYNAERTSRLVETTWDLTDIADGIEPQLITEGRIGLRHMSTKQFTYKNFVVERL